MIHLNISIVLTVLFCVNFVNSFLSSEAFLEVYKTNLHYFSKVEQNKKKIYAEYDTNYDVCNKPKEARSAICRNVIRGLKADSEDYNNLYINYLAFAVGKPCRDVKVWINEGELLANQPVMNCFGSSAIMSPESSEKMVYFYRKIVIYPWNATNVLVFEYNEGKNYYMLVKLHKLVWNALRGVSGLLFSTLMPQNWREVPNLYSILSRVYSKLNEYSANKNNIVNSGNDLTFRKICFVTFQAENYKKRINYKHYKDPQSAQVLATLRGPIRLFDIKVPIKAYTCKYSIVNDEIFMSKYYVAAGPGDHSVILLKEMEIPNSDSYQYEIIELVEYLTDNFLYLYFKLFY